MIQKWKERELKRSRGELDENSVDDKLSPPSTPLDMNPSQLDHLAKPFHPSAVIAQTPATPTTQHATPHGLNASLSQLTNKSEMGDKKGEMGAFKFGEKMTLPSLPDIKKTPMHIPQLPQEKREEGEVSNPSNPSNPSQQGESIEDLEASHESNEMSNESNGSQPSGISLPVSNGPSNGPSIEASHSAPKPPSPMKPTIVANPTNPPQSPHSSPNLKRSHMDIHLDHGEKKMKLDSSVDRQVDEDYDE
eukprot:NODE_70_length_24940_cov_0.663138.p14 type:complete len:248 gc:universal NODE_70_length_24940_cov_0.663138:4948-5691(+)